MKSNLLDDCTKIKRFFPSNHATARGLQTKIINIEKFNPTGDYNCVFSKL